jgi:hypothetical protein
VTAALGRPAPRDTAPAPPLVSAGHHAAWLASAQQWLMELALAGFKNLSAEALNPFAATLEQIQSEPKLGRVAALLTGFHSELLNSLPADAEELPSFRWADLWTRSMLAAQEFPPLETGVTVSGRLLPLGVDVRTHAHFASLLVYGVLEAGNEQRLVRVPLSRFKVDVVAQREIWQLFRPAADPLLESLAQQRGLQVSGMQLLTGGDLLWTGKAKLDRAFDPIATAAAALANALPLPPVPPLVRHPVQLAELICLEQCSVRKSTATQWRPIGNRAPDAETLEVNINGGGALPIALERMPADTELGRKALLQAGALIGLLRFDRDSWAIQPLGARTRAGKNEKVVLAGESALEFCAADKLRTLETLSERAGKLLRQH